MKMPDSETYAKPLTRRRFLRAAAVAAPLAASLEESVLLAQGSSKPAASRTKPVPGQMPRGKIGGVEISRLLCGGNLISGHAHSRDLIYVSSLLKRYFTEEKVMETWALCEQHGIDTMVATSSDARALRIYEKYAKQGGKIQYIAQVNPTAEDLTSAIGRAADSGAVGAFLLGNLGDAWSRQGPAGVERIGKVIEIIKDHGMIAGTAGHELRTIRAVEEAGIDCDYYVKTLHHDNYWSKRRPDQNAEIIDNYKVDNYWCRDADETIAFMAKVKRPWIAYKVLAAGAISPRDGFRYAFENGADFALVGMFDFQIDTNVAVARDVLAATRDRRRAWIA